MPINITTNSTTNAVIDDAESLILDNVYNPVLGTVQETVAGDDSPATNEIQTIEINEGPFDITGTHFTLSFKGEVTDNIAYNASTSDVQDALNALTTVGANGVTVTGSTGSYVVEFTGDDLKELNQPLIEIDISNLVESNSITTPEDYFPGTVKTKQTAVTGIQVTTSIKDLIFIEESVKGHPYYEDPAPVAAVNEQQTVTLSPNVSGGTFKLTFAGDVTTSIAYNASAATVETALNALDSIGASGVTVTLSSGVYTVEFSGDDLKELDQPMMGFDSSALTFNQVVLSTTTGLNTNTKYYISSSSIPSINQISFTTGNTLSQVITLSTLSGVTDSADTNGVPIPVDADIVEAFSDTLTGFDTEFNDCYVGFNITIGESTETIISVTSSTEIVISGELDVSVRSEYTTDCYPVILETAATDSDTYPITFANIYFNFAGLSITSSFIQFNPVAIAKTSNKASSDLSGFIINKNESSSGNINTTIHKNIYQEFRLPESFARHSNENVKKYPRLTGIHLDLNCDGPTDISYELQVYEARSGWSALFKGSYVNNYETLGRKWLQLNFEPFEIKDTYINNKFRIILNFNQGVSSINYVLKAADFIDSQLADFNTTEVIADMTLRFRLMGDVADSGLDIFENKYRSLVYQQSAKNTLDLNTETWWLSKANPSKYAVESLYFDLKESSAVDAIFLDPVTPNVQFTIYYHSGTEVPGDSIDSWDALMWTPVPKQFTATKRQNYLLPYPITARYFKIEFSSLQAQTYVTGDFQKPIKYNKYPQWVLDYFLSIHAFLNNDTFDPFIANTVDVSFDILNLAYNYYKDDIVQIGSDPNNLKSVNPTNNDLDQTVRSLLISNEDGVNSLDTTTYLKVKTDLEPFMSHPVNMSQFDSIVSAMATIHAKTNAYSVEDKTTLKSSTNFVSNTNRDQLILERTLPQMYFFLECRHGYREAIAKLPENKAYFVGMKEVAFQRRDHKVLSNDSVYSTVAGDVVNSDFNNFKFDGKVWTSR